MYHSKECGPYNSEVDNLRDVSVVPQILEAQKTFLKYLSGVRYTADEMNSLKDLQERAIIQYNNPFLKHFSAMIILYINPLQM